MAKRTSIARMPAQTACSSMHGGACWPASRSCDDVTRTETDGKITILADRYKGKRFNEPNDLTVDSQGRIYFSDPCYGHRDHLEIRDEQGRTVEGVYRIDPDGKVDRVIAHKVERANGVLVSAGDALQHSYDHAWPGRLAQGEMIESIHALTDTVCRSAR